MRSQATMLFYVVLLMLPALPLSTLAQPVLDWRIEIDQLSDHPDPMAGEGLLDGIATDDDGWVVLGNVSGLNDAGDPSFNNYLARLDSQGNLLWERVISSIDFEYSIENIMWAPDQTAVLLGSRKDDEFGGDRYLYAERVQLEDGATVWELPLSLDTVPAYAYSAAVYDADQQGYTIFSILGEIKCLTRISLEGAWIWTTTTTEGPDTAPYGTAFDHRPEADGYILMGTWENEPNTTSHFWYLGTDAAGDVEWGGEIDRRPSERLRQLVAVRGPAGYVAGSARSGAAYYPRLMAVGTTQFDRIYPSLGTGEFLQVIPRPDGELTVLATVSPGGGLNRIAVASLDPNGVSTGATLLGDEHDAARYMVKGKGATYLIVGQARDVPHGNMMAMQIHDP